MKLINKRSLLIIFLSISIFILLCCIVCDKNIVFKINKYKYELEVNTNFEIPSYNAYIFGKDVSNKVKVKSNVNIKKTGTYKVIYELDYLIFSLKKEIKIKVLDKTNPTITLKGDKEIKICPNSSYEEYGFIAQDNYDGDITNKVKTNLKDNSVEYIVYDSSNNKASEIRNILYEDKEAPNLKIIGDNFYQININTEFNVPDYEVEDNCDKDVFKKVEIVNDVDSNKAGTYKVTYKVKDDSGNETIKDITVKVMGSYSNSYSNIISGPTYINGILIVNKKYSLPSDYGYGVDSEAGAALNALQEGARKAGYSMPLLSGYRSYYTQQSLYNSYVSRDGVANADRYSARPGHSEHQTGLAFDVGAIDNNFGNTNEGIWLAKNAHLYGFIIRYPMGKEYITGYMYEPWHIRYVGTSHAQKIYESGLTLEEYLGV